MIGFIYFLKNPVTQEIFYIGASKVGLDNRLKAHYLHMKEAERGERNWNKRFEYLKNLMPHKAEIHSLEEVEEVELLDQIETLYIGLFRSWNFSLVNATDGGKGGNTYKHLNDLQKAKYKLKLQLKLKGRSKPDGFADNMSKARMGVNNPMAGKGKSLPVVAFDTDWKPVKMFKYAYETYDFCKSVYAHSNIIRMLNGKMLYHKATGYNWKYLKDCDKQTQDIVERLYESKDK
jgi:hypothetical protein